MLGGGAFCSVFKIKIKNSKVLLLHKEQQTSTATSSGGADTDGSGDIKVIQNEDSKRIPNNEVNEAHNSTKSDTPVATNDTADEPFYALKCLSDRALQSDRDYAVAALDLAFEAKLLSQLHHENIISLYATNYADNPNGEQSRNGSKLILVLGLLKETLQYRLVRWRAKRSQKHAMTSVLQQFGANVSPTSSSAAAGSQMGEDPSYKVTTVDLKERISSTAVGIANGMAYLAKNHIVMRDLKVRP